MEYVIEIRNLDRITEEELDRRISLFKSTQNSQFGYMLAYAGFTELKKKTDSPELKEKLSNAACDRVITMLIEDPKATDTEAIRLQTDQATALLSHFTPVPEEYKAQIIHAAEIYNKKNEVNDSLLQKYVFENQKL